MQEHSDMNPERTEFQDLHGVSNYHSDTQGQQLVNFEISTESGSNA